MKVQEHELLVELSGDIDLASSNIVLDVAGLEHVDATFLRFLVNLKDHAAKERSATVELVGVTPRLRQILEITGLSRAFVWQAATETCGTVLS